MHVRTDQKLQEQRSVRDGEVPSDDDAQLAPFPVLGTLVGFELDGGESRIRACFASHIFVSSIVACDHCPTAFF